MFLFRIAVLNQVVQILPDALVVIQSVTAQHPRLQMNLNELLVSAQSRDIEIVDESPEE